ncbi:MAG: hypothetical protein H6715_01050 [Myxococcales bacterium]|nr:hypothetical protein [Myxococcales bacterium]MCB9707981.1 hypothetical protein [Myxococcales bacterium]
MELSVLQVILVVFVSIHALVQYAKKRKLMRHMEEEDHAEVAWEVTEAPVYLVPEQAPSLPNEPIVPDAHRSTARSQLARALRTSLHTPDEIVKVMAVGSALAPRSRTVRGPGHVRSSALSAR